ncbi:MAG: HIT family protein [Gammaproteobacteria bacterium]
MNPTMEKFGYPDTLVREYAHWSVQLRPKQATLGALVVVCKETATKFGDLSAAAFAELKQVTSELESSLGKSFAYSKLNYLMLMMVDPDVHFHVLPRYPETRQFHEISFADVGWPGPPDLSAATTTAASTNVALIELLRSNWPL